MNLDSVSLSILSTGLPFIFNVKFVDTSPFAISAELTSFSSSARKLGCLSCSSVSSTFDCISVMALLTVFCTASASSWVPTSSGLMANVCELSS